MAKVSSAERDLHGPFRVGDKVVASVDVHAGNAPAGTVGTVIRLEGKGTTSP